MFLKFTFCLFYTQIYFLGVLHYFGHNGFPVSQILNPHFSFDYFNQAIMLIKLKLCFQSFQEWFETKAAKIGDFWHLNFTFGHLIYPNEPIFHALIEEN